MVHVLSPRSTTAPPSPASSQYERSSINESTGSKSHSSSEESLVDVAPVVDEVRDDIICAIFGLPPTMVFYPDYSCALVATIAFQGRMYPASDRVCFYSNLFGKETKLLIPYDTITEIAKTSTMFSHAFRIKTATKEYTFTSFWGNNRDLCFDLVTSLRNKALGITPVMSPKSEATPEASAAPATTSSSVPTETPVESEAPLPAAIPMMSSDPTPMYDVMKYVFPISVEMFVDNFFTDEPLFGLVEFNRRKGATEIKCDPWSPHPGVAGLGLTRTASFVLPVDAPIGPKSTRVNLVQERRPLENGGYLFDTSTRLADIPYGDYFAVEDRWILHKLSDTSLELCVQLRVVFSKSTMWRGTIESRAKSECKVKLLEWIEMANTAMSPEGLPPYPQGTRPPSPRRAISPRKVPSPRKKAPPPLERKAAVKTAEHKPDAVARRPAKRNIMPILFPWLVVIFLAIYVYRVHSLLSTMEESLQAQQVLLHRLTDAVRFVKHPDTRTHPTS
ncbi:GRAM domain-containing protein 1A [Achlya hypogyna]|uniref:GRAM domain-containing protein 1A n=1 Tax=Achlya hypogyna TaxID=1202772 RepID=A0A1V9ZFM8_ACHHY|nr:GRAM domain-containing protein 1A [Achlya hypogyna]